MIKNLEKHYTIEQKSDRLFKIHVESDDLLKTVDFISLNTNFITLAQIACADWIEDEFFTLNYILTTDARDKNLMVETNIPRIDSQMLTLLNIFPQAEVMERDLHEMYGIDFIGNQTLYDFALEDWKGIPPLRREFDTLEYVNEHFDFKKGRDDNKDVKVEMKRRRAEAKRLKDEQK